MYYKCVISPAWPRWDLHVRHRILLSVANLHYTLRFVVNGKTEGRKCTEIVLMVFSWLSLSKTRTNLIAVAFPRETEKGLTFKRKARCDTSVEQNIKVWFRVWFLLATNLLVLWTWLVKLSCCRKLYVAFARKLSVNQKRHDIDRRWFTGVLLMVKTKMKINNTNVMTKP